MNPTTTGDTPRTLRSRVRRGGVLTAIAALLLCAVAACGDDGADDDTGATPAAAAADAFPQTLKSPFGETILKAAPKRVLALGVAERDTVLALGVTPVAAGGYGELDSWFTTALGGKKVENLEISDGIPFEKVASFGPDLIITGWGKEQDYKQLSAIAPVLWQVSGSFSTNWRDQVTTIAKALGKSTEAQKLITETEAKVKAAATANPGFAGKTFTWSTYDPGLVNTVDLPTAPVTRFLGDLGLKLKPELANPQSEYSREISPEQLTQIDANVIIIYPSSAEAKADLEGLRTWQSLAGVKAGGAVFLDDALANGLNSPTLLSIPFVLDKLTPLLAKVTKQA
ncbi:iron-siderophore ABC transporter substrate-binding protein [Dactylosporangium sp. CA-233914]|uniref:iron-siderophore ABC transporter substrate-binding protein n=1 Tax=Dactylosporangium sp. CA-233914 TaxID=3239934 RepID=UPI003D8AE494